MDWRLKKTDLRRSFFALIFPCLVVSALLTALVYVSLGNIINTYPNGGVAILPNGEILKLAEPTEQERAIILVLRLLQLVSLWFPAIGMWAAGSLFNRWKLKPPIDILLASIKRIRNHDLDFTIPEVSGDELGQVCAAFETMRAELLKTNRELWRQAEERKRLNAAFAHDLRNPVTVLKGTVKQLQEGAADSGALERLEVYTVRIERYIEAMSGVQRLEQLPVERKPVDLSQLRQELEETVSLLAPELTADLTEVVDAGTVKADHGLFLTVAENLIGNAAQFARSCVKVSLEAAGGFLLLTVEDDGPGFPPELVQDGPKPFGKFREEADHFGMGLYTTRLLCWKHGGELRLKNRPGALAEASFEI